MALPEGRAAAQLAARDFKVCVAHDGENFAAGEATLSVAPVAIRAHQKFTIAASSPSSTPPAVSRGSHECSVKVWAASSDPSGVLSRCEGDCDSDADCEGDLRCFQNIR